MQNQIIEEIQRRIGVAFEIELKMRKLWVKAGFPESTAPSAIGLIGDKKTGYECLRYKWWKSLRCEELGKDLDYWDIAHKVEKTKIPGLCFGS